jgi:hypothetical protein
MSRIFVVALVAVPLALLGCKRSTEPPAAAAPAASEQPAAVAAHPVATPQGSSELPPGHPPIDAAGGAPQVLPPQPGSGTGDAGMSWSMPAGWVSEVPSNAMRRAQYRIPGPGGEGECVVSYFGPGQGGPPKDNIQRWASQFKKPNGEPATDIVRTSDMRVGDVPVTIVEVEGTYVGGMGSTMSQGSPKGNQALLGAIVEGPDANWFFKFIGPEATVKAQRAAFEGMLRSLKKGA